MTEAEQDAKLLEDDIAHRMRTLEMRLAVAEKRSPIVRRLTWATFAIVVLSFALTGFGLLLASSTRSATDATNRGTDIAACRSLARGPFDTSSADASVLILEGLAGLAESEGPVPSELADSARATAERIRESRAAYDDAVRQSLSDPEAFLDACQELAQ